MLNHRDRERERERNMNIGIFQNNLIKKEREVKSNEYTVALFFIIIYSNSQIIS